MNAPLKGAEFSLALPVTLSWRARRDLLISTGTEPSANQVIEIKDLRQVPQDVRGQIAALSDEITLNTDLAESEDHADEPVRVTRYGRLYQSDRDRWEIFDADASEGESTLIDRFFFASEPGRTHSLLPEFLKRYGGDQELEAMLRGSPLVDELRVRDELRLEDVLLSYQNALDLAASLEAIARKGKTLASSGALWRPVAVTDDLIVFFPSRQSNEPAAGFLREADPETFVKVGESVAEIESEFPLDVEEAANAICGAAKRLRERAGAEDRDVWEHAVKPHIRTVFDQAAETKRRLEAQAAYEADRAQWIGRFGSRRLKLAVERGYKHDGIYRDERLASELPGFMALKGKLKVGEDVNPTEEALEAETETLAQAEKLGLHLEVRLVWVTSEDFDFPDGEYVQVSGYLGRHRIYRPVFLPLADDDIPF